MISVHMGAVMNDFVRRAANVFMVLSLIPAGIWLIMAVVELIGQSPPFAFTIDGFLLCILPWAVLWFIGYMLDIRMPWQIIRKAD